MAPSIIILRGIELGVLSILIIVLIRHIRQLNKVLSENAKLHLAYKKNLFVLNEAKESVQQYALDLVSNAKEQTSRVLREAESNLDEKKARDTGSKCLGCPTIFSKPHGERVYCVPCFAELDFEQQQRSKGAYF